MRTLLFNCNLVLPEEIRPGYVVTEDDRIAQVGFGRPEGGADRTVDLGGRYLAPGFVELHSHGAGGADFMDGTVEAFATACHTLMCHGTTTLLPTTLAASPEEIYRSIDAFRAARTELEGKSLNLHGLHMEGPYLNVDQCGAIDPKYIRDPAPEEYEAFLDYGRGAIKRWTLAVERPGADRFADALMREGVLPSLGHSNAEYSQVLPAFEHGVTHVTHLYSSMSTITRHSGFRHSGVLESAFCIPDMTVEVIADGCHLPAELLNMVWRFKGPDRVALTCDSMRCAGQDVTESILGSLENGQRVIIEDGVAKLPDRMSFAGSIATDDRLVRVMTRQAGVPLHEAVRMMSLTPANVIGIGDRTGSVEVGKDADLICFDDEICVCGVMVRGRGLAGLMKE
ncbi:MAG: N-acetylglucosamine-6-phosphate deacetylase [Ruminococcaceae bacterium]|nr:N-acetylglucosamine-6-phosphate deacetylase [Oscillospiraceae bacterium]